MLMPLSEHEQRLLEQMERALYAEDPKFATTLRHTGARGSRGKAALGVLAVLGGMGVILAGVATQIIALGVVGFTVMLVGAVLAYSAFTRPAVATGPEAAEASAAPRVTGPTGSPRSSGFMDRMEERWRKRHDEGQA